MNNSNSNRNRKYWQLYLIVSVSGASILSVEILGTRVLAPFYGSSIFLWSALITVTLAALCAGYALGGRIADRKATMRGLGVILALGGILLTLVPLIKGPVISLLEPLGLRPTVLIATFIMFFPSLMVLGMVSPYSVKLRASSLDEVGRAAGNLYAVSTLASVAGALLTGFILIPEIGVSRLIIVTGILLFVCSGFAVLSGRRGLKEKVSIMIILLILTAVSLLVMPGGPRATGNAEFLAHRHSPYAEVSVLKYRQARFLLIDGAIHTFTDDETNRNLFQYVNVMGIPRMMFYRSGKMLLIGLGGGAIARHYSEYGWDVDGVEIDPVVATFAQKHFGLKDEDADIHIADGRRFLWETSTTYDIIILDAFGNGSIPFHLITREALELASSRLAPEGILAVNILSVGWRSRIVRSMASTLRTAFPEVVALPIAEPPNTIGNVVLLASNRSLEIPYSLPDPGSRFDPYYDRAHAWQNRFRPKTEGALVFTDDRNPIDLWGEEVNLVDRRKLADYFENAGLSW